MNLHFYDADKNNEEIGILGGFFMHRGCRRMGVHGEWTPVDKPLNTPTNQNSCGGCGKYFIVVKETKPEPSSLSHHFI